MPAQVAVVLAPSDFLTNSETGFVAGDERAKRRRTEAISQLRKAGSPYEHIGKQRAFKSGHKGSTFPWANTAAALHEHAGACWLASEIAIIAAASPFRLAYTKRAGATAFGSASHPSEHLAQARANNSNAGWWREQLEAADDDRTRAEWALALWSTASGGVVSELLLELTEVLAQIPGERRRTVLRAAGQIARFGWLTKRPVTGDTVDTDVAALNKLRASGAKEDRRQGPSGPHYAATPQPSLLSVARAAKWLKVDSESSYR
jgi:hypothetical protein